VVGQAHARQTDPPTRKAWLSELQMSRPKSSDARSWLWRRIVGIAGGARSPLPRTLPAICTRQTSGGRISRKGNLRAATRIGAVMFARADVHE
jgi:hypothetical protein